MNAVERVKPETLEKCLKILTGTSLGCTIATEATIMGVSVWVHEVIGHGWLGGYLVRAYQSGSEPTYWIRAFESMKRLAESKSLITGAKGLAGLHVETILNKTGGLAGWAKVKAGTPNALGRLLGPQGLSAWTSLSGCLPTLFLSLAATWLGCRTRKDYPLLCATLLSCAATQWLLDLEYPFTALLIATPELISKAKDGHDFANIAVQLSAMTGYSAKAVAYATFSVHAAACPTNLLISWKLLEKRSPPHSSAQS